MATSAAVRLGPDPGGEKTELAEPFYLLYFLSQHRHSLKQVANNPVVSNIEDRRLGIFVDRHDRA